MARRLTLINQLMLTTFCILFTLMQLSESRDIPQRQKRWSTTFISRPVEQHDCKTDADCSGIPFTSCAQDPSDKKYKCLCADSSQPNNGDCKKKPKELRTPCAADYECLPGAECIHESDESKSKVCSCQENYIEANNTCTASGGNFTYPSNIMAVLVAAYALVRMY